MNSNGKNKFKTASKRAFVLFLGALMLTFSALPAVTGFLAFAEETPATEPLSVGFASPEVQADSDNVVAFKVALNRPADFDVTVYFHTENRSAIDGEDYRGVKSSVVISRGQTTASVAVKTNGRTPFQTTNNNRVYSRHFALVLDSVTDGVAIRNEDAVSLGILYGDFSMKIGVDSNIAYATVYHSIPVSAMQYERVEAGQTMHTGLMQNETKWVEYVKRFGAKVYGRLIIQSQNENASFIKGGTDHWIAMGNTDFVRDKLDEDASFADGLLLKFKTETCGNAEGVYMYEPEFTKIINGQNPHGGFNEPEIDVYTSSISYYKSAYLEGSSTLGKTGSWVQVTRGIDGSYGLGVSIYNSASYDSTNYRFYTQMRLVDQTKPVLQNYMFDTSSLASEGILRLILRFDEPVYVGRTNTSISVYLNGSSNATEFDYAGGNYSDTLYFEWKAASKVYTSYRFEIQPSIDIISDLAYNISGGKAVNNVTAAMSSATVTFEKPINYTKPEISFENKTSGYSRYHEVDVTTGTVEKGTLYYLWDQSPDDVRDAALYGTRKVDFIRPYTTVSFSGVNGSYYLHVMVVSELGQVAYATSENPYHFDNTAPFFEAVTQENLMQKKKVSLTFFDTFNGTKPEGGGIDRLTLCVRPEGAVNDEEFVLFDARTGQTDPLLKLREDDGEYTATLLSSLFALDENGEVTTDEAKIVTPADSRILELMAGNPRTVFSVHFELTDVCGNTTETRREKWIYDGRGGFETEWAVGDKTAYTGVNDAFVFDIGTDEATSFTVSTAETNGTLRLVIKEQYDGFFDGITAGGIALTSGTVEATGANRSAITLEGLHPGCYEIEPYFLPDGASEEEILVSSVITFYVTSDFTEKTENGREADGGNLVLRNEVYRLTTPFYYLEAVGETPKNHPYGAVYDAHTGKYEGGSTAPCFSSLSEMRDYVTFMEYQDMYLVCISAGNASSLNSGSGSTVYVKADGETQVAAAGQLWIRYKRANWTPSGNAYSWAFYYYGTGSVADGIDLRALSANLREAIYRVRDTICDAAETEYLIGDSGRSSADGSPSLKPAQVHPVREEATVAHAGTVLSVPVSYDGDEAIYDNGVVAFDGVERPLVTNVPLTVSESTKLYFKYGDASADVRWTPLDPSEGDTYRTAIGGETGIYTILELDEHGANVYEVYLDVSAPTLTVVLNGDERVVEPDTSVFSGTTFSFVSLTGEVDPYAYVGIYSYTTGNLIAVYYADRGVKLAGQSLAESNFWVEVGDRSGNSFTFLLRLATGDLAVTAEVTSSGSGVRVTVDNRLDSEIYRYEVSCNNVIVSNEFAPSRLFTEAGIYTVLVQDIYGNTYRSGTVTFNRRSPELQWSYLNAYGTYSSYNPNTVVSMLITDDEALPNHHYISTSTLVRFRLPDDGGGCSYEFTGLPENGYKVDATGLSVSVQELGGWSLKVWYTDYPDNYEQFDCVVDHSAPNISVTYIGTPYTYNEGTKLVEGTSLIPETLKYTASVPTVLYASNGDIFHGTSVNVSTADEFGVKTVTVTLNGKPVTVAPDENGVWHLTGYGTYKVVATDLFGNTGTFTFINTADPVTLFTVDGGTPASDSLTEILYGHESLLHVLKVGQEAEWLLHIGDANVYYHFRGEEYALRLGHYERTRNEEGVLNEEPETVFDEFPIASADVLRDEWQVFLEEEGYTFSVRFLENGDAEIRLDLTTGTVDAEVRVRDGQGMLPSYREVMLSKNGSDVKLTSQNQPVVTNQAGNLIFVNHPFKVAEVSDRFILSVEIAYSETLTFGAYTTVWTEGDETPLSFNYSLHGYYSVRIVNRFGNETVYTVLYSDAAGVVATATYQDGLTNTFTAAYGKTVTGYSVTVTVYSLSATVFVNGEPVEPTEKDGTLTYTLSTDGLYDVTVRDAGGTETCFEIRVSHLIGYLYSESWITGYNEKALRLSEGYTNQKLTVVPNPSRVSMVTIRKDGVDKVVYDTLSEHPVTDPALLENCVGNDGDGVYSIIFRNAYGAISVKTIHYRETPTLVLSRVTAISGGEEPYPIETALKDGFYSNNTLRFATEASSYRFTVNGDAYSLDTPRSYEFRSATGNGSFRYEITYIDEYGFEYAFEAVLFRQTVEIGTDGMDLTERAGLPVTKGDAVVTFAADCFGTVLYGEEDEAVPYVSGTPLRRDGTYRFTVTDKAGNIASVTVVRDTTVWYRFTDTVSEEAIETGGVVNDSAILFAALNDDNVHVEKAILDGKEITDVSVRFAQTGKWEFLLSDDVGNRAYFSCYLINHELSKFTYRAPYGYTVTEVWLTDKDGNRTLTSEKGGEISLTEDGDYAVILTSDYDNRTQNFTVTIDNTPPAVHLSGVENGGETAKPVSLEGLSAGDEVTIWRNGELVYSAKVETVSDVPTVEEGGHYRVLIRNRAGVEQELTFSKKYIANAAASVFIVVGCLSVATVIFIGLLYRNRSKTDK